MDTVTVFGAALCQPGSELYAESERLGQLLAKAGFTIVNGGYTGTMEGSAKGAKEAGGAAVGVLVPSLFTSRSPSGNEFLSSHVDAPTLLARIDTMIRMAPVAIALPGTLGTLTELCAVWNTATLAVLYNRPPPLILAYRKPWEALLKACAADFGISEAHISLVTLVEDAADAVETVKAWKANGGKLPQPAAAASAQAQASSGSGSEGVKAGAGAAARPVDSRWAANPNPFGIVEIVAPLAAGPSVAPAAKPAPPQAVANTTRRPSPDPELPCATVAIRFGWAPSPLSSLLSSSCDRPPLAPPCMPARPSLPAAVLPELALLDEAAADRKAAANSRDGAVVGAALAAGKGSVEAVELAEA